ncbi:4-hydroxybenzoate octaprenyltransferase [Glaciecola sp. 1036]|uniref:4-hydroxybenzoate octaprenyltransferase n=1 Tax=Alteromonadaceae TaxID=72275 RepID=UPI003CFDE453
MLSLKTQHFNAYWRLMRADRPIGSYLLLWPTMWSVFLSSYQLSGTGVPPIDIICIFVMGVFLMRSAGCVINDYADRNFDGSVERTKSRPLATGEISEKEALQLFSILIGLSFILVLQLNWQTILLSVVALLLASVYPFMKRHTHFPQVVLGAAYSWSIPMAAMAILETVPYWAWVLYFANLLWTVAYDTQYAMVDRDDDLKIGIKSTAVLFGKYDLLIIAILQTSCALMLAGVFWYFTLTWPAYLGLGLGYLLFIRQWISTKNRDRDACFQAFLNNHIAGMCIGIGVMISVIFSL